MVIWAYMKKEKGDDNPILALWQRVILDGRISKLAIGFREELGMPIDGFDSLDEYNIWHKKFVNKEFSKNIDLVFQRFVQKSKEIIPYEGLIGETIFQMLIFEFLILNEIKDLESFGGSGMSIVTIKDSKQYNSKLKVYTGEIEDGVYIKIKPFSTIERILKYIENNRSLIRAYLKDYVESENLKKPKKIKASSHFKRDKRIILLNQYSKKDLEKVFEIKGDYKEMVIRALMNKNGYQRVTSDIVKAVIRRRRIDK